MVRAKGGVPVRGGLDAGYDYRVRAPDIANTNALLAPPKHNDFALANGDNARGVALLECPLSAPSAAAAIPRPAPSAGNGRTATCPPRTSLDASTAPEAC